MKRFWSIFGVWVGYFTNDDLLRRVGQGPRPARPTALLMIGATDHGNRDAGGSGHGATFCLPADHYP